MPDVIVLSVSYDGTDLSGFARQPTSDTVQGRLEAALATILRAPVETVGAGRTDAGVHALGQLVTYEATGAEPDARAFMRSLNALCGPDVVVTGIRKAAPGFSARFSAVGREYRYRIVPGPVAPLFLKRYAWWTPTALNLGAMREAAGCLLGEHDFRSFCAASSAIGKRTVRRVEAIEVVPAREMGEHCIVVRIVGNAFLHSMVRIIVGSLVEVGRGKHSALWMKDALEACDRSAAGPTAPPQGLTLWQVDYPEECWL
ncbi:MAG: tRNA pseudouridine(38-40) synthase TruA [Actinomycetia bacterium]|nr:tRNA pseudouridine(38-40) synthase TruA [Actinomycetes bacterium]